MTTAPVRQAPTWLVAKLVRHETELPKLSNDVHVSGFEPAGYTVVTPQTAPQRMAPATRVPLEVYARSLAALQEAVQPQVVQE